MTTTFLLGPPEFSDPPTVPVLTSESQKRIASIVVIHATALAILFRDSDVIRF